MLYLSRDIGERIELVALQDGRAVYTDSTGVCSIPSVHGLGAAIDYLPASIDAGDLGRRLFFKHHIEIKGVPRSWLNGHRVSTHVFNSAAEVDQLADALEVELRA